MTRRWAFLLATISGLLTWWAGRQLAEAIDQ